MCAQQGPSHCASRLQSLHAQCPACMRACTVRAQVDALEAALSDGAAVLLGFCHNDLQVRRKDTHNTHSAGHAGPLPLTGPHRVSLEQMLLTSSLVCVRSTATCCCTRRRRARCRPAAWALRPRTRWPWRTAPCAAAPRRRAAPAAPGAAPHAAGRLSPLGMTRRPSPHRRGPVLQQACGHVSYRRCYDPSGDVSGLCSMRCVRGTQLSR